MRSSLLRLPLVLVLALVLALITAPPGPVRLSSAAPPPAPDPAPDPGAASSSARPSGAGRVAPVAARSPGFAGLTTPSGHELGVARLPDGTTGLCLDAGPRPWPTPASGHRRATTVTDPVVGYLLSVRLPRARRDPAHAAALWWAIGLLRGRNSGPAAMRAYLAELGRVDAGLAARVRRTGGRWVRDAVRHAAPRHGYRAPTPVLAPDGLTGLGLRSARGLPVPGVRVHLRLTGGATFADGRTTRAFTTTTTAPAPVTWRRGSEPARAVGVQVTYAQVPEHRFRLHRSGPRVQRVATSSGLRILRTHATAPALRIPVIRTQVNLQHAQVGARLVDAVTVSGLGTRRLPSPLLGEWQLLGPVAPAPAPAPASAPSPAACQDRDWSGAPLAGHGRFTVPHDGTFSVGATQVTVTGCYTYRERLAGSATTAPAPWTPAGLVEETTLVTSAPHIRTLVNRQRATEGDTLVDKVVVTGLPTGPGTSDASETSGSSLTGQWQLLGPVAPDRTGRCARASWTGAPVAGAGTFAVPLTGATSATVAVGRTRITRGGCYTYREALAGSPHSAPVSWTAAGIAEETSLVGPRPVPVPHHPRVDTGGSRKGAPQHGRTRGRATVALPRLGLTATLSGIAFRGSVLPAPRGARHAGQWTHGASLDALVGTTVLTGHVADDRGRPGAFAGLRSARRGDVVRVAEGGTVRRWRVIRTWSADRSRLPRSVFTQDVARRLVLITCTDRVATPGGGFHYRRNLVVEAVPW